MSNNILLDKYNKINKKLTNLQINNSNKQYISMLLCIYMLSVIIRFLIAIIERQPHIMGDELSYTAMAYNFYKMGNFYPIQNYGVVTNLPNILYQFVISFSFYFGENFYIIIKLINCLLISLIIFPGYMLLKEYMTKDKAVIYTSMTILIPFNNITSFAMAENLFFPLFSISFYFSYKLITEYKHKYVIFTSFSITLLYLTKPHAIALILSLIATIFIIFIHSVICKNSTNQKQSIVVLVKVLICTTLMLFSITFIIKGQISVEALLGAYKKSTLTGNKIVYPIGDFFKMALSHITITSIVYFVPIIVCIYVIIKGLRKESMVSKNKVILSILSLMTFCAFLAMTIKFTIYIYKDEHFLRLHARYYYMTFICLYYAAICFINDIKLNKIHKLMVILGFAIINIVNYCI